MFPHRMFYFMISAIVFFFIFFFFFDVASWTYCYFIWNSKVVSNSGAYLGIVHVLSCAAQYKRRGPAHSLLSLVYTHFFFKSSYSFSPLSRYFSFLFHSLTHAFSPLVRAGVCVCACAIFFSWHPYTHTRAHTKCTQTHTRTHVTHITYHIWYI